MRLRSGCGSLASPPFFGAHALAGGEHAAPPCCWVRCGWDLSHDVVGRILGRRRRDGSCWGACSRLAIMRCPPVVVVPLASFLYYFGSMQLHLPLPTTFTAPAPPGSDDICDFETILYGRARVALSTWRVDVCLFASSAIKSRSGIGADMCVPGMAGWAA